MARNDLIGSTMPPHGGWMEIIAEFESEPEDWSFAAGTLADFGCPSSRIESDPPRIISSIVNVPGCIQRIEEIRLSMLDMGAISFRSSHIPDEDWMESFRLHFKAREIGDRFIVIPSWDNDLPDSARIQLLLDPGQAFGTGDHPTTRMCLELLDTYIVQGSDVWDIGCGSGILAIAAKKLDANYVLATDIEGLSVEVTKENCLKNGVEIDALEMAGLSASQEVRKFDLILSNIISATLIRLAPEVTQHLKENGRWIVSGIITANWEDVLSAAKNNGFTLLERKDEDGWVGAIFQKN